LLRTSPETTRTAEGTGLPIYRWGRRRRLQIRETAEYP
jgi:hypothetical protein